MNPKKIIKWGSEKIIEWLDGKINYIFNVITIKNINYVMFVPHYNSMKDGYDILNPGSDNVLCFFDSLLRDVRYNHLTLILGYYNKEKIQLYKDYCNKFRLGGVQFFYMFDRIAFNKFFNRTPIIFTDETFKVYPAKVKSQKIVCLNYYAGFMKNDFFRIKEHGGYKKLLKEQKKMYKNYDYIITISDVCSMFTSVEDCVYYGSLLPLGFPRNDIFFQDNQDLRRSIEDAIGISFKNIITYVPTHRDYENEDRDFFDLSSLTPRSLFGPITLDEAKKIESVLENTNSVIIAKVHPMQVRNNIKEFVFKRVIFYQDLIKKVNTSLNPIMAISDALLTDYSTAVYDFMYTNRPIIYYFYDYEKYNATRGLFIEPINSICMGDITYNISQLCNSIVKVTSGKDEYQEKRRILSNLLIKDRDGKSSERIKQFFLDITI